MQNSVDNIDNMHKIQYMYTDAITRNTTVYYNIYIYISGVCGLSKAKLIPCETFL